VLGNLVDLEGFDYVDSTEVRDELLELCAGMQPDNALGSPGQLAPVQGGGDWERIGGVPMYSVDAQTRRAHALQLTPDAWGDALRLNAAAARTLGLETGGRVRLGQDGASAEFAVRIDDAVPDGCVWLPTAVPGTEALWPGFGVVTVEKV
jgi:NADH-quinone oxidoreductase subunit G